MRYISIDLETTCINPKIPKNILGLSMVIEDSSKPEIPLKELLSITFFLDAGRIEGEITALRMNGWILQEIEKFRKTKPSKYHVYQNSDEIISSGQGWIKACSNFLTTHFPGVDRIPVAGKNAAGFDLLFLPEKLRNRFRHGVIDPGSVFIDWSKDCVLGLQEIKNSMGIHEAVSHDMYEDALDVIGVLRKSYPAKGKAN